MYVTRLHAPNNSQIPNLLEAAIAQANIYGLEKIVFWNPDVNFWSNFEGANITNRIDSLSSMALQYKGRNLENFDWINNEKYAWV